ncbi:MAG: hypothetical protein U0838_02325, partial [Chloroflexota bacterium]
EGLVRSRVQVTAQLLLLAKENLTSNCAGEVGAQVRSFLGALEIRHPDPILIHPSVDVDADLSALALGLSARMALGEAVWALIGAGVLVPRSDRLVSPSMGIAWTTVVPGSGGQSSSWNFESLAVPMPANFSLAPSRTAEGARLSDGDLFLATLGFEPHPLIAEAVHEAVRCLRADLYLPALAMLAKAAEGAWTQLAAALGAAAPGDAGAVKLAREAGDGSVHFATLVTKAVGFYERRDLYPGASEAEGASLVDVRHAREWTEVVRDGRNVVHFGATTRFPNTYEKAAVLFLGAAPALRTIAAATSAVSALAPVAAAGRANLNDPVGDSLAE